MKKENKFQSDLIKDLSDLFPDAMIQIPDPGYIQGFPDILVLFNGGGYAALECKRSKDSKFQPNQKYYIDKLNTMSYSSAIYPENREEILNELQSTFGTKRTARVLKRK